MELGTNIKLAVEAMIKLTHLKRLKIEGEGPDFKDYQGSIYRSGPKLKLEIKEIRVCDSYGK